MISAAVIMLIIAAVVGSTAMTAVIGWIFLRLRASGERELGDRDLQILMERVEQLTDQLESFQTDMTRLGERMDFTERLLTGETVDVDRDEPPALDPGPEST